MVLHLLGIGPGDEVIVPAYTYTASASVVTHVGATIVMVDSQKDCVEMDYEQLVEAILTKTQVPSKSTALCSSEVLHCMETKRTKVRYLTRHLAVTTSTKRMSTVI